jgi:hypothetical protein
VSDSPWNLEYFREIDGPGIPLALPATSEEQGEFTANWAASARAESYRLDLATDEDFTSLVYDDLEVSGFATLLSGLDTGTNYFYRLRAVNRYGTSENSNVIAAQTTFVPSPVATDATAITETRATVNWESVDEAVTYRLDVSADPDFGTFELEDVDVGDVLLYALTGLDPDTAYYFRVRAVDAADSVSLDSNVVTFSTLEQFAATGGTITTDGAYTVHTFDASADFVVTAGSRAVRRLIVAGGGAGGGINGSGVAGGGGGGGGARDLSEVDRPTELTPGTYPVVVGAGGVGVNDVGGDGGNSSFDGDTSIGGGGGGGLTRNGRNGGSGGGAGNSNGGPESGGTGTAGQGNNGGAGSPTGAAGGGGGGGAAGAGAVGDTTTGGNGGDGLLTNIRGVNERYGAGGGGAIPTGAFGPVPGTTAGTGGATGGANGRTTQLGDGIAATGKGNGGGGATGNWKGGNGTPGRVVIRYLTVT